jgi:hypothetical protein
MARLRAVRRLPHGCICKISKPCAQSRQPATGGLYPPEASLRPAPAAGVRLSPQARRMTVFHVAGRHWSQAHKISMINLKHLLFQSGRNPSHYCATHVYSVLQHVAAALPALSQRRTDVNLPVKSPAGTPLMEGARLPPDQDRRLLLQIYQLKSGGQSFGC